MRTSAFLPCVVVVVLTIGCSQPEPPPAAADSSGAEQAPVDGTLPPAPAPAPVAEPGSVAGPAPVGAAQAAPADAGPVFINGVQLTAPDFAELKAVLGATPAAPGRYWYDAISGLWGLEGHGAGGVTRTGLTAAPLPADASAGKSGAFVNGRQLPVTELAALATLLGWPLPADARYSGHYTLDGDGALNLFKGRYLGNVAAAAKREAGAEQPGMARCIWYHLYQPDATLGRDVTIACD